jgi:predicted DNA-binding protein
MTQKIILSVPDEMHDALQRVSRDTDKVIAAIVRRAIAEHLAKEYDIKVEHNVQRGGDRRSEE